jgi:hypothetical protein
MFPFKLDVSAVKVWFRSILGLVIFVLFRIKLKFYTEVSFLTVVMFVFEVVLELVWLRSEILVLFAASLLIKSKLLQITVFWGLQISQVLVSKLNRILAVLTFVPFLMG